MNPHCVLPSTLEVDVVIVGAGMVGSALAAALGKSGLRVAVIEAGSPFSLESSPDGRASALSLGSARILDQLGAWDLMQSMGVSPIHRIEVSDARFPWVTQLNHGEIDVEALGYIVENRFTQSSLQTVLHSCHSVHYAYHARLETLDPQPEQIEMRVRQGDSTHGLRAQLVVGADGSRSQVRSLANIAVTGWDYPQVCVVTTVTTESPHQHVAYERFQPSGPFAILPMTDPHRSCVVWTIRAQDQERILALDDSTLITTMTPSFGEQLGRIQAVTGRSVFRPCRLHARRYGQRRVALVGDAAHASHPVGGQGVNMGFRDVAALATVLIDAHQQGRDLGSEALLHHYHQQRYSDNRQVLLATDTANRLFSNQIWPLQWGRRAGLIGIRWIPSIRHRLMRRAMGIAVDQPQTVPTDPGSLVQTRS